MYEILKMLKRKNLFEKESAGHRTFSMKPIPKLGKNLSSFKLQTHQMMVPSNEKYWQTSPSDSKEHGANKQEAIFPGILMKIVGSLKREA